MNKIFFGLLAGIILGAGATWLVLRRGAGESTETPAPAAVAPEKTPANGRVHLTKEQLAAADIATSAPQTVPLAAETDAFGRVLDPAPFITLVAENEAAAAALAASQKEFDRVKTLHEQNNNASAQSLETAAAALARDRVQLASSRARLLATWGRSLAEHADLPSLIKRLSLRETALVRIDVFSSDAPAQPPAQARARALASEGDFTSLEMLGIAPSADAQVQGVGYLALWSGAPPATGTALRVLLASGDAAAATLVLPRCAFVRREGGTFVFVQTGDGEFERRRVEIKTPVPAGIPVASGVAADDRVVTRGAQQLLSTELDAGGVPE